MKCLYGSQNLGYAIEESDKDYMEFIYPSWKDVLNNKCTNTEIINDDGSHTKVIDIRKIPEMILSGHFTSLQFMFSVETENFDDLQWFIDNRDRICKCSLYRSYLSNSNNMINNLKKKVNAKEITRAKAFLEMSKRLIDLDTPFKMFNPDMLEYRHRADGMTAEEVKSEADKIVAEYKELKKEYLKYENVIDYKTIKDIEEELYRLLKKKFTETEE